MAETAKPVHQDADKGPDSQPGDPHASVIPEISERSEARGVKGVLSRLLPAQSPFVPREIEDIVRLVRAQHPKTDTRGIVRAFLVAKSLHEGQLRKSGEQFIEHPVGVARILAELGMDDVTVMAAFLHDTLEDTDLGIAELEETFGSEVAQIIDGLTKIEKIAFRSKEQERAGNLRKMIVAMAKDLRVLIIKLADRLHNMRTIEALDPAKRQIVANETLEIYAPLAHRLGMQQIRGELEDLAFRALHPKRYAEIEQMVSLRQPERRDYIAGVIRDVQAKLREVKIKAEVSGRPKHFYSIYEKMVVRSREFDEIFDLVGVRIIVDSIRDCYAALGAIHSLWKPVPGRFKDYVAMPKFNLYQSLHTTVIGAEGKPLEIQLRTAEMHRAAEWGVASHWQYKEEVKGELPDEPSSWMQRMLDLHETEDDTEFLDTLRLDLFADEVFVFTPKGDVKELTKGATPIDFAYSVHTEVGHRCVGAKVDGKLVPLSHQLSSGETVEVITSKTSNGPSRDWLEVVVSPRARTKIKQWFTRERREEAVSGGREALVKGARRAGLPIQKLMSEGALELVVSDMKLGSLDALYAALGEGRISVQTVVGRLVPAAPEPEEDEAPTFQTIAPTRSSQAIVVKGVDDVWVKLARCCMPVPGDSIVGFITRGRGVSVHRSDCSNSVSLADQKERFIDVTWDDEASGVFTVSVQVEALDRPKLLRDVTTVISDLGINIRSATSVVGQGIATLEFTFDITNPSQLSVILNMVRKVEAVYDVYRITPQRH